MLRLHSRIIRDSLKQKLSLHLKQVRHQSSFYEPISEGLSVEVNDQVLWVKFNRPQKYNAITKSMYVGMTNVFKKVNQDSSIKALVLTGTGDYYSSGNDLSNLTEALKDEGGPRAGMSKSKDILIGFVDSLINLQKFLIAAVNGPAVGIPVTTLPLCDLVVASDKATFYTPFTALGQCPEACSSVTFPQIMGTTRANELLLLNMKWDASKAKSSGLVSEVIEHSKFYPTVEEMLYGKQGLVANCYPNSMKVCKSLIRNAKVKQTLREVNRLESEAILECWLGKESVEAAQKFMSRSKK